MPGDGLDDTGRDARIDPIRWRAAWLPPFPTHLRHNGDGHTFCHGNGNGHSNGNGTSTNGNGTHTNGNGSANGKANGNGNGAAKTKEHDPVGVERHSNGNGNGHHAPTTAEPPIEEPAIEEQAIEEPPVEPSVKRRAEPIGPPRPPRTRRSRPPAGSPPGPPNGPIVAPPTPAPAPAPTAPVAPELPAGARLVYARPRTSRGGRVLIVVAVFAILGLAAGTVMLWQHIEEVRQVAIRPRHVAVALTGVQDLDRRINRLETETGAIIASPPPGIGGQVDSLRRSVASLQACVAAYQAAVDHAVQGQSVSFTYC